MAKKYVLHVISGTHWDREWRHTAEQSKPRLVELIDMMIDTLEKRDDYKTFILDGGLVVVEDYLTVKPENRDRLKKLIQAGRVQLVNWYTLPDTFTVAPEALLRNIKLGQKMAEEFGEPMKAGYTATSYGQTSQLPQIYQGFGITNCITYRGTNKYLYKPLFAWEGADGSRLHMLRTFDEVTRTNWFFYIHQPLVVGKPARDLSHTYDRRTVPVHLCDPELYERAIKLLKEKPGFAKDEASLKKALDMIINQAKPYAIGKHILALNMEDNDVPFELLPDMIEALNKVSPDVEIVQSTMDEYMAAITKDAPYKLPVHKGELRYTVVEPGFNGLLGATHSSRIRLKLLNEQCETKLMFQAEPLSAFDALLGGEYPKNFLDRAWRFLLLNQAHDSICGAAVDQAHEDMLYNFSIARMVAEEITGRSVVELFKRINTADTFKPGDHTITMFNTLPYEREQVTQLVIDMPQKGSGGGVIDPCTGVGAKSEEVEYYDILDVDGKELEYKELSKEKIQIAIERELDTKGIKMPAIRRRVLVKAKVPAFGYASFALRPRGPKYVTNPVNGPDRALLARENGVLENEFLKVTINSNGTFDLLHKATGRVMANQHYFSDNGEVGSAHISRATMRNPIQTSLGSVATITMVDTNELRGTYKIELSIKVPAAATEDGRDRLREERTIPITTWLTLDKGAKYLKVRTKLHNDARDHRLRVNFPSYVKTDYATVESAFAIEKRCVRWTVTGDNGEGFYPFQPMQNFVDVNDGKVGLAVLNKGLREYEVKDDNDRTIAITLLRTQRAYMTANSDMIPEEYDKYTGLHSFGTLEYNYALYPHTGDWDNGKVLQAAYDFKVAINAIQGVPVGDGNLPATGSFFTITPSDKLMVSALKQADDGKGVILRLWNTSDETFEAKLATKLPIKSASLLRLDETEVSKLKIAAGKISFKAEPHKIITLRLQTK